MPKKLVVTNLVILATVFAATAYAQDTTPPRAAWPEVPRATEQKAAPNASTVTAIVVKSWGDNAVWSDLNTNWSKYGTIPVSIDHTTLIKSDFTYQDLVNSGAAVVILSDAAGGVEQYSSTEFAAINEYAKKGHSTLATYATFAYGNTDNRRLAPVFGLSPTLTYTTASISGDFQKVKRPCLFAHIVGSSWQSNGFNTSQVPSGGSWNGNLLKATAEAQSDSYVGVISLHSHTNSKTGAHYTGIYVSNMPEYQTTGGDDEQLLYNAIMYGKGGSCYGK